MAKRTMEPVKNTGRRKREVSDALKERSEERRTCRLNPVVGYRESR